MVVVTSAKYYIYIYLFMFIFNYTYAIIIMHIYMKYKHMYICVCPPSVSLYTYVCSYFLGIQQVVGAQHIIDMSLIRASATPPHLSYRKEAECLREGLSQHVPCAFYHGDLTAEARQKAGGCRGKRRTTPTKIHKK